MKSIRSNNIICFSLNLLSRKKKQASVVNTYGEFKHVNLKSGLLLLLLLLGFLINYNPVTGQETHYWFHNYGASSYLKGGIEVGGSLSNSTTYYNPGALSFIEGEYFEAQADVVSLDYVKIENGLGNGISARTLQIDAVPSIFSYSRQSAKNQNFVYSFSVLTKAFSNIIIFGENEEEGNYLLENDEQDVFHATYNYNNRVRENWISGALSIKLNQRIGIGLAGNFVIRSQDFVRSYNAEVFPKSEVDSNPGEFSTVALVNLSQHLTFRGLGIIFKPGIRFDYDNMKFGLTATLPNLNLGLLNSQSKRTEYAILPDINDNVYFESGSHTNYAGIYKTPYIIEAGFEYFFKRTTLATSLSWFSKINSYQVIKAKENSYQYENSVGKDDGFALPNMANKSVLNLGIAVTYEISKKVVYGGSIRTDFNFFDEDKLDRQDNFVPNMTYWDIYHLTSGIMISGPRTELSIGLNYGLGLSQNDPQLVNMTNPSQENFLQGPVQYNTRTQYHNFGFILGLNYNINRMKGLKKDKL